MPGAKITKFAEHNGEGVTHKISPISENLKPTKMFTSDPETVMESNRHFDSGVSFHESITTFEKELATIPQKEDLKFMDPVSLYECKIQTILLSHYMTKVMKNNVDERNIEKIQDKSILGIDIHLLAEILRER